VRFYRVLRPSGRWDGLSAHWQLDDGIDTGPTTLIAVDSSGSLDPNWNSYSFDRNSHDGDVMGAIDNMLQY